MANRPQDSWYVSFELPRGKRAFARGTETFPNEREAKQFAKAKLGHTLNIIAGTSILMCRNVQLHQCRYLSGSRNRMKPVWLKSCWLILPPIIIRMRPSVRRDLAPFGQLDHVNGRLVAPRSA